MLFVSIPVCEGRVACAPEGAAGFLTIAFTGGPLSQIPKRSGKCFPRFDLFLSRDQAQFFTGKLLYLQSQPLVYRKAARVSFNATFHQRLRLAVSPRPGSDW